MASRYLILALVLEGKLTLNVGCEIEGYLWEVLNDAPKDHTPTRSERLFVLCQRHLQQRK